MSSPFDNDRGVGVDAESTEVLAGLQTRVRAVRIDVAVDGGSCESFLVLPMSDGRSRGRRRPGLVVGLHGGPTPPLDEATAVRDAAPWNRAGFAYFAVDYRASGALGADESSRVLRGEDVPGESADARDVWAAFLALEASPHMAFVDPSRIVLYGFSYGAYVLNRWVTSGRLPESVTAAVCHEGVADLRSLDEESLQIQISRRGSTPDENPAHWADASPIERADAVTVRMLLAYGSDSPACAQGRLWRSRLREHGAEVHWLECRGEGHQFSQDGMDMMIGQLERLLQDPASKNRRGPNGEGRSDVP